jgi:hypothetical protein
MVVEHGNVITDVITVAELFIQGLDNQAIGDFAHRISNFR